MQIKRILPARKILKMSSTKKLQTTKSDAEVKQGEERKKEELITRNNFWRLFDTRITKYIKTYLNILKVPENLREDLIQEIKLELLTKLTPEIIDSRQSTSTILRNIERMLWFVTSDCVLRKSNEQEQTPSEISEEETKDIKKQLGNQSFEKKEFEEIENIFDVNSLLKRANIYFVEKRLTPEKTKKLNRILKAMTESATYKELGIKLGVSRQRAEQIFKKMLILIRRINQYHLNTVKQRLKSMKPTYTAVYLKPPKPRDRNI